MGQRIDWYQRRIQDFPKVDIPTQHILLFDHVFPKTEKKVVQNLISVFWVGYLLTQEIFYPQPSADNSDNASLSISVFKSEILYYPYTLLFQIRL